MDPVGIQARLCTARRAPKERQMTDADACKTNDRQLLPDCVAKADRALDLRLKRLGCLPLNLVEEDEVDTDASQESSEST